MATIFVSSVDGNNSDNGSTWTLAKQTVAGALAIAGDGDVIKVDSNHAFSAGAAINWAVPNGANIAIISVNRASGDAWLAGASESVGASTGAFTIGPAAGDIGSAFIFGMRLNGGTGSGTTAGFNLATAATSGGTGFLEFRSCTFDIKTANTASINIGTVAGPSQRAPAVRLRDCTFIASGSRAGNYFVLREANVEIINPTFSMTGGTKPASLFAAEDNYQTGQLIVRDGDASGYAVSGGAYFDVSAWASIQAVLKNLRLSATPSMVTGAWPVGWGSLTLRDCDSGNTDYGFQYIDGRGTLTAVTSVHKTNGALFNSEAVSWQIVTSAAASENKPFTTPMLQIWAASNAAQSPSIDIIHDSLTALTDRQIWFDLDAPASASQTNYSYASGRNANPFTGTGSAWGASSVSWTDGGMSNPNKQLLGVGAVTAARDGLLQGRIYVAVASKTLYVDPMIAAVA